jgi:hypothetical protein
MLYPFVHTDPSDLSPTPVRVIMAETRRVPWSRAMLEYLTKMESEASKEFTRNLQGEKREYFSKIMLERQQVFMVAYYNELYSYAFSQAKGISKPVKTDLFGLALRISSREKSDLESDKSYARKYKKGLYLQNKDNPAARRILDAVFAQAGKTLENLQAVWGSTFQSPGPGREFVLTGVKPRISPSAVLALAA